MSLKMLIVDDSKPIFLMVSQMVQELGHELHWAVYGLEAIEKCKEMEFDVILLDWNMPEMDGMEFLEKNLADKVTSALIIMMTTENKLEKIQAVIEKGVVEYIMKPFTTDIFQSKLEMAGIQNFTEIKNDNKYDL